MTRQNERSLLLDEWRTPIGILVALSAAIVVRGPGVAEAHRSFIPLNEPCPFVPDEVSCGFNAECTAVYGTCEMGVCSCLPGRFAPDPTDEYPTHCVKVLRVGQDCSNVNIEPWVLPEFAKCHYGRVECLAPFKVVDGDCVPTAEISHLPGEPCDENIFCNPFGGLICGATLMEVPGHNGTVLLPEGICMCPDDFIFVDGFCRPALYGDPCASDVQCNSLIEDSGRCSPQTKRCVCNLGFEPVSALVSLPPKSSKQITALFCMPQISSNSYGSYGSMCTVPFLFHPNQTLIYCHPHYTCVRCPEASRVLESSHGVCQFQQADVFHQDVWPPHSSDPIFEHTKPEFQSISAPCDPLSKEPPLCGRNAKCMVAIESPCDMGRCLCANDSFVPSKRNPSDCEPVFAVGDLCQFGVTDHRLPEHAICDDGVVRCVGILRGNKDSSACVLPLRYGSYGDQCDGELFQCDFLLGLVCANATGIDTELTFGPLHCRCGDDLIYKDGRCRIAMYGDKCWNNIQCAMIYEGRHMSLAPARCHAGSCLCKAGFSPAGFEQQTYCVDQQHMVLGFGQPCLATPSPISALWDPDIFFCRSGLTCWQCPEYDQSSTVGMCLDDGFDPLRSTATPAAKSSPESNPRPGRIHMIIASTSPSRVKSPNALTFFVTLLCCLSISYSLF